MYVPQLQLQQFNLKLDHTAYSYTIPFDVTLESIFTTTNTPAYVSRDRDLLACFYCAITCAIIDASWLSHRSTSNRITERLQRVINFPCFQITVNWIFPIVKIVALIALSPKTFLQYNFLKQISNIFFLIFRNLWNFFFKISTVTLLSSMFLL